MAVVREGGVRAAADRLHYSPSTVRTHVRLLEQQLHVRLLARGDGGVLLTAAGEALAPAAVRVDQAVTHLEEQAALIADGVVSFKAVSKIRAPRGQ